MGGPKINRNFIVAHQQEARPIIEFYRLTKDVGHRAFTVYANDNVKLVISGEGKINCAAATTYCYSLQSHSQVQAIWINLGIAGHAVHPIGSLWRINKVIDSSTSNIIFPINILRSSSISGESLISVDQPETAYPLEVLYDMEASSFFQIVSRFVSLEYINSFKIVSDNITQPIDEFNRLHTSQMIESYIEIIDDYLNKLEGKLIINFNKMSQIIELKEKLFRKYKFTHAQKLQCEELLKSLAVHGVQCGQELLQHNRARQILDSLSYRLKQVQLAV